MKDEFDQDLKHSLDEKHELMIKLKKSQFRSVSKDEIEEHQSKLQELNRKRAFQKQLKEFDHILQKERNKHNSLTLIKPLTPKY